MVLTQSLKLVTIEKGQKSEEPRSQCDQLWTVKQSTTKAEIIATLHLAAENIVFSPCENLGKCYQMQFPD